jgi:hypothetical protein
MFAKSDGPTALRPDLVRALAFSMEPVEIETSAGRSRCEAGMAAIWTGSKGEVVVVIRQIEPPAVARYRFTEPIVSPEDVDQAVDAALGFVTSMGFQPDAAEFGTLSEEAKRSRLSRWDGIRKVRKPKGGRGAPPADPLDVRAAEPAPEPLFEEAPAPPAQGPEASSPGEPGRNVLGRIPLVRRDGSGRGVDPLGRLLSFF